MVDAQDYSTGIECPLFYKIYKNGSEGTCEFCDEAKKFLEFPEVKNFTDYLVAIVTSALEPLAVESPFEDVSFVCLKAKVIDEIFNELEGSDPKDEYLWVIRDKVLSLMKICLKKYPALETKGNAAVILSFPEEAREFAASGKSYKNEGHVYPSIVSLDGFYNTYSWDSHQADELTNNDCFFVTTKEGLALAPSRDDLLELAKGMDLESGQLSKQSLEKLIRHFKEAANDLNLTLSDETLSYFKFRIENNEEELLSYYVGWWECHIMHEREKIGAPWQLPGLGPYPNHMRKNDAKKTRSKAIKMLIAMGALKPPRQHIIPARSSRGASRQRAPHIGQLRSVVSVRGGDSGDDDGDPDQPEPPSPARALWRCGRPSDSLLSRLTLLDPNNLAGVLASASNTVASFVMGWTR